MATKTAIRPAELAARLRVALWRSTRRMRHATDVDLSPTLHAALGTVEKHGPITAGQLAAHEKVQKPTITRTIRELVGRGLIERLPDPLDGRVTWLQATPEGKALLQSARRRADAYLTQRLKGLSAEERETLLAASEILERFAQEDDR